VHLMHRRCKEEARGFAWDVGAGRDLPAAGDGLSGTI
jgi:hypothetical protein